MSFFNKREIEKILSFALEAGGIAAKFFVEKNFVTERKADGSQVTSVDRAISKFLQEKLTNTFPQIPVICEEGNLREISGEIFFLIDPIDGTSSLVSGSTEFSINIALIQNRKAVFGLIYAPLFEGGKMIFSDENGEIAGRKKAGFGVAPSSLRIITSSRTKDPDVEKYVAQIHPNFCGNFSVEKLASAIKFFRILEGDADLYLHFRNSMEWDTAAGQALVELLGGKVKKLFFNQKKFTIEDELSYKKPKFENQPFVITCNF